MSLIYFNSCQKQQVSKWNIVYREMYFENFIQNDKMIKYLFDQDIVITEKFFNELKEKLSTLW